jgi:hypothetical protein
MKPQLRRPFFPPMMSNENKNIVGVFDPIAFACDIQPDRLLKIEK